VLLVGRVSDLKQACEEVVEQLGGLLPVGELVAAEPADLVAGELQGAVLGDHLGVAPGSTRCWSSA